MTTADPRTVPSADAFCASGSSPTHELVGNPDGPLVAVLGGISADRCASGTAEDPDRGWWSAIVGPGRPIDTTRVRVLSYDYLGSPNRPAPLAATVSTADQAEALRDLLDELGIEHLDHLVGASYGGMVGLAFAARHPGRLRHLVVVAGAHRTHPLASAWRTLQRGIVDLGEAHAAEADGLRLARGLAMTTYRSAAEFDERFGPDVEDPVDGVAAYLAARGEAFARDFNAAAYRALSESLDRHAVAPGDVRTPTDLIAIDSDVLVPAWLVRQLRDELAGPSRLRVVNSSIGHDAFLADPAKVGPAIRCALGDPVAVRAASPVTRTVRAGGARDAAHGAVMPPVYLTSNYTFAGLGQKREHDYSRTSNPTRDHLAGALAELEEAAGAVVTSSGMSAVALALQLLGSDDLVVMTNDCYGGTHRLATRLAGRGAFRLQFADLTTPEGIADADARAPRMYWVETPSNPLLRITDLDAVARAARRSDALVVVDNTFLSPALQRPHRFGADIIVHSTTKFINGHSDVVGGAATAALPEVHEELAWWANALGVSGSPFDCYQTLRGLRTLGARVRVHQENARAVAEMLDGHPAVKEVLYPGLPSHPGHALAEQQQDGPGSLLSFTLHGGLEAIGVFVDGLRHCALAESLGGVESLIEHRASVEGPDSLTPKNLLRLSVGIEAADDLIADLEQALAEARFRPKSPE